MSTTSPSSSDDASTSSASSSSDHDDSSSAPSMENRNHNCSDEKAANPYTDESSTSDSESDEDEDDDQEEQRESTSHLPLGERLELEATYGIRKIKKESNIVIASTKKEEKKSSQSKKSKTDTKTKKSKHAPTEASSKRSDFFATLRQTQIGGVGTGIDLGAHRYHPKDPRVNNLHGHLQEDHFQQNFAFVQDLRKKEIKTLQRNIHAWKTPGRKGQQLRRKLGLTGNNDISLQQDQERVKELRHEIAEWERQEIERAAHRSVKQKLQDQAATTGKFYFPKRRDLRKMQDEAKMQELRKRKGEGAVEKVLAKRRKKNKSKDASLMGAK